MNNYKLNTENFNTKLIEEFIKNAKHTYPELKFTILKKKIKYSVQK